MTDPERRRRYRQRQAMVEPVFGVLKQRQGLTRFRRRGLAGVRREFALHVMAYNLGRATARWALLALLRALQGAAGWLVRWAASRPPAVRLIRTPDRLSALRVASSPAPRLD
jgi:hypothetical protein